MAKFDNYAHWQKIVERRKERPSSAQKFLKDLCRVLGHDNPLGEGEWTTEPTYVCTRCHTPQQYPTDHGKMGSLFGVSFISSK